MKGNLLSKTLVALGFCLLLVILSYFFIDRQVADFAYTHDQQMLDKFFISLTYISSFLFILAPVIIVMAILKLARTGSISKFSNVSLVASINLLVADSIKDDLKYVFGRYWPETWVNNNPSWISNHAYGFHWFKLGQGYQSFPSGHTTIVFAFMSVFWIMYPKLRWLCVVTCGSVVVGLIAMNYHFVSDVLAGAFLGSISGMFAVYFAGLFGKPSQFSTNPEISVGGPTRTRT